MHIDLSGRTAVVTGAGRTGGIGAAVARQLAAAGASVFITTYTAYDHASYGTQRAETDAVLAALGAPEGRAGAIDIDLGQPAAAEAVFAAAEAAVGPVSILVNNAAFSVDAGITDLTPDLVDRHYRVNVRGIMLLCQAFASRWPGGAGGRIVNLTSGQGAGPMPGNLAYAATKGAVDAFTTSLSVELMPRGVTVNAVDPGPTDTGWMTPELRRELARQSPAGRISQPDDAARLICWLASDQAAWVTGQVIRSRGGL